MKKRSTLHRLRLLGLGLLLFMGLMHAACQESTSDTIDQEQEDTKDKDTDKNKVIDTRLFSISNGTRDVYLFQSFITNMSGTVDFAFTPSGNREETADLDDLLKADAAASLMAGQSFLYEVEQLITFYDSNNRLLNDVRLNRATYPIFGTVTIFTIDNHNTLKITPATITVADRYVNASARVKIRAYIAAGTGSMKTKVNANAYSTFTLDIAIKGPQVMFESNTVTTHVSAGHMVTITAPATNVKFMDLPDITVPTWAHPISHIIGEGNTRRLIFEVLTNGHSDLPAGKSTSVEAGSFEANQVTSSDPTTVELYALDALKVNALFATRPTAGKQYIYVKVYVGRLRDLSTAPSETNPYEPIDGQSHLLEIAVNVN